MWAADPDLTDTMTAMPEVPAASVDAIFSSHNIEHLEAHEVPIALAEFRRVLRPGGFVLITCPDLKAIAARVLSHGLTQPAYISPAGPISPIDRLFGLRPSRQPATSSWRIAAGSMSRPSRPPWRRLDLPM